MDGGFLTEQSLAGRSAPDRRIVSVHLPRFSIERWQRVLERQGDAPPDDLPAVLAVEGPHGPIVHAATHAAERVGIRPGARVTDMHAIAPGLRVDYADLAGDRAALERLMLWMRRWCPWSCLDGDDGLFLNTTGSDHLWGGEAAMLAQIEAALAVLGFSADLALAPTPGAAWALARFGPVRAIATPETLADDLAPLPVRALRIGDDDALVLDRLGLKTMGALAGIPRAALSPRFPAGDTGVTPLVRLDQAMARASEPLDYPDEPPRFSVRALLPEPVEDPTPYLGQLCHDLCAAMEREGMGARRLTLSVYRTDGEVRDLSVATAAPSRDAPHLERLWGDQLERIDPGFGFDLVTLGAPWVEPLAERQGRLSGASGDGLELARLVDRLTNRLGARAVTVPAPKDSHMPERREDWHPALGQPPAPAPPDPLRAPRPLRLLDTPEEVHVVYAVPEGPPAQIVWRKQPLRVVRFAGPERIAPEWWADRPSARLRDYYRVEIQTGQRFWLFREGVHGEERRDPPRWCIHGIFA
ncbi:Y-family DNA polymerase [Aestuariibius sp. 2305UL40-4]|uniref:Y-family DNA polymerase n=1 Tax=Aestuariibius violaceus TaxID=3234132 RepID=UPI00345E4E24